jgi:hypothetical protein
LATPTIIKITQRQKNKNKMVSQMQEQQQELGQATPAIHYLDTKLLAKNDTIHKLQFQQRTSNSGTHKLV